MVYHHGGEEILLDDEEEESHRVGVEENQGVVSVTHLYEEQGISFVARVEVSGEGKAPLVVSAHPSQH